MSVPSAGREHSHLCARSLKITFLSISQKQDHEQFMMLDLVGHILLLLAKGLLQNLQNKKLVQHDLQTTYKVKLKI